MYEIEVRTIAEQPAAVVRSRVDHDQIASWFANAYATLANHLQGIDVATVGLPFARCAKHAEGFDAEAGLPVAVPIDADGDVEPSVLPGGPVAVTWHQGEFATSEPAYEALEAWLEDEGLEAADRPWEVYHGDPSSVDTVTWMTEVHQPYER